MVKAIDAKINKTRPLPDTFIDVLKTSTVFEKAKDIEVIIASKEDNKPYMAFIGLEFNNWYSG